MVSLQNRIVMKLAILCSGQAGQHRTMLNNMLVAPDLAELREMASDVLKQDIATWWQSLNDVTLFENTNAQFAIALFQIANWQKLAAILPVARIEPVAVAGYSLGEVMAWHVAGAIDTNNTLHLVRERARLMNECFEDYLPGESCMALCRARISPTQREARSRALEQHQVPVAIYRPDGDFVMGAPAPVFNQLMADADMAGIELKRLPVEVPSHTHWLNGAVEPFSNLVHSHVKREPTFPVVAGIDGSLQRQSLHAANTLSRQLAQPIRWDWCVETLASLNVDVAIELGPGNDLSRQIESRIQGVSARSLDEFTSNAQIQNWLDSHK
jgi:[acyl-carrier-protein] S-malonyltransferase